MMIPDDKLKEIVAQVVRDMIKNEAPAACQAAPAAVSEGELPDISAVDLRTCLDVPNPENAAEYLRLKAKTPARLGVYRAGPRYRTETLLRFRADHAVAMDAVFTDVDEAFLHELGLFSVQTKCATRDEHLTRPDLGRQFDEENAAIIRDKCKKNPKVQIYASDGLSSTAITANLKEVMPALLQGLKSYGYETGTPFFVKYGRVGAMDAVTEIVGAEVTLVFIGERPGLATGESMSAYITYKGKVGMPEAGRSVVSNIHKGGTPAVEAGAHIAHIINEMFKQKASGLDLKL